MKNRDINPSFNSEKKHESVNFKLVGKAELQKRKLKLEQEKKRKKIEKILEKKIEKADKKDAKRKIKKESNKSDKSQIPSIPLNEFEENKPKEKKESFFRKFLNLFKSNKKNENKVVDENKQKLIDEKRKKKEEKIRQKEEAKRAKEEKRKKEKEEELLQLTQSNIKLKEKIEKEREEENKKEEAKRKKLAEKERIRKEKEDARRKKIEEKERIKAEKEVLNTKVSTNTYDENGLLVGSKTEKEQEQEAKKLEKQRKEELKKAKLKEKIEEEARRRKAKEDRDIILITEKREKEKKIEKEKEQAKKEKKEKALLIKKAKEELKAKQRSERKTFKEKVDDWYNNLAFVKDRKNRRELQRQTLLIDFEGADAVRSEEKIMYKYVAKNNETGKVETGFFAAFSKLDVHSFLIAENYEVYEITPQKNIVKPFTLFNPKFKNTELDFFLTQLSTFLKSGITLVESIKILSKQSKKKSHKNIYKSIIYELTMGENFSEALSKQGDIFPRLLINMIKTSELTGDLPETLDDMANYYREVEKTRKQMISAMSYPIVVFIFAIVILIFMLVSVVPQFVGIYNDLDTDLPGITVAIISMSNFIKAKWILILVIVVLFVIIFIVLFKTVKVFKSLVQTFVMNLPIIGKIIIYNEVTMFTKTFASLLNHNVYITDSMEVLSKITNNEVYKMLIFDTITNLAKGEPISKSFKNHWAFPNVAYEMILTGEKTGQLGTMMQKVSDYYQELHKNAVNQIRTFIEPVMIILIAAIVGVILLSIVIPMFDMYESLSMQGV